MTLYRKIKLVNTSRWKKQNRWEWSVWLEGSDEELDKIDFVEFVLHPTFRDPIRMVTDRDSKFRLDSGGWGEFMIHANVAMRGGERMGLDHWLRLSDKDENAPSRGLNENEEKTKVFMSFSRADSLLAARVSEYLKSQALEVVTDSDIQPGESAARETQSLIGKSDALLALVAEEPSRWVTAQMEEAQNQRITVIPVLLGESARLPEYYDGKISPIQISDPQDLDAAVESVKDVLKVNFKL